MILFFKKGRRFDREDLIQMLTNALGSVVLSEDNKLEKDLKVSVEFYERYEKDYEMDIVAHDEIEINTKVSIARDYELADIISTVDGVEHFAMTRYSVTIRLGKLYNPKDVLEVLRTKVGDYLDKKLEKDDPENNNKTLQQKLDKAVAEEKYEVAAEIKQQMDHEKINSSKTGYKQNSSTSSSDSI